MIARSDPGERDGRRVNAGTLGGKQLSALAIGRMRNDLRRPRRHAGNVQPRQRIMRQIDDARPGLLLGLDELWNDKELAGSRTSDAPEPFAFAHQAILIGLERSDKLRRYDVANHPVQCVVVRTVYERRARPQ